MARFLVLPGDVRFNFGDTAILHGTLALVRSVDPSAEVVVAAGSPLLPGGLEDVRFAGTGARALWREARRADVILWGGGQLLQGNRSRLKLPYQAARIAIAAAAGKSPIVGIAQGVGPLPREIDRRLVARMVRRTAGFSVRDDASRALLESCGVPGEAVRVTADPALLLAPTELPAWARGNGSRPRLGLAARFTGHHDARRLVPYQVLPARRRRRVLRRAGFSRFVAAWIELAERLVERLDAELVLVPTYPAPWETDVPLAEAIAGAAGCRGRVTILRPRWSVEEVTGTCRELDAVIAVPMHATILAVGQRCPTLGLAYEGKGSSFLKQTGSPAFPVTELIRPGAVERIVATVEQLVEDRDRVRTALDRRIKELRCRAAETATGIRTALEDRRLSS